MDDTYFSDLDGNECNLYLPSVKPDHAFFRLGRNLIVLSDGCRRFDFKGSGKCIKAADFYESNYLNDINWLGPFYCKINFKEFILLKDVDGFEEGDSIATIDEKYYWIHSPLYYDSDDAFLKKLM